MLLPIKLTCRTKGSIPGGIAAVFIQYCYSAAMWQCLDLYVGQYGDRPLR